MAWVRRSCKQRRTDPTGKRMIPAKALQEVPTYAIEFVEQDEKTKNFWGIAFPSNGKRGSAVSAALYL